MGTGKYMCVLYMLIRCNLVYIHTSVQLCMVVTVGVDRLAGIVGIAH